MRTTWGDIEGVILSTAEARQVRAALKDARRFLDSDGQRPYVNPESADQRKRLDEWTRKVKLCESLMEQLELAVKELRRG